eukprot:145778_1
MRLLYIILCAVIFVVEGGNKDCGCEIGEYTKLWTEELTLNNLTNVYNIFWQHNLFKTEFLIYLNDELELNEIERYKISVIAKNVYYRYNQIESIGIHESDGT